MNTDTLKKANELNVWITRLNRAIRDLSNKCPSDWCTESFQLSCMLVKEDLLKLLEKKVSNMEKELEAL